VPSYTSPFDPKSGIQLQVHVLRETFLLPVDQDFIVFCSSLVVFTGEMAMTVTTHSTLRGLQNGRLHNNVTD